MNKEKTMKKDVKLYSAFFPFYGILLANYKDVWWMMLANIAVLTLTAFLVLKLRKTPELKKTLPKVVGLSFVTALAADAAALLFRYLPTLTEMLLRLVGAEKAAGWLGKYVSDFTWYEIWAWWNRIGLPWTVASIAVAGVAAFLLHYYVVLKKVVPDKKTRLVLSICLAIFSAPYTWTNPAW